MNPLVAAAAIVGSYLLGSVSFSYVFVKRLRGIDLRTVGSGNLGATNAGRVLGRKWAAVIYVLDLLKGLVAAAVGRFTLGDPVLGPVPLSLAMGGAAFAGHCWPVYTGFRGGKGVATASGVIVAHTPAAFACSLAAFGVALAASRRISVGSMVGALTLPVAWLVLAGPEAREGRGLVLLAFFAVLAVTVVVLHRKNIHRLLAGTEPRIGGKKP